MNNLILFKFKTLNHFLSTTYCKFTKYHDFCDTATSGVNKGGYWGYLPPPPRILGPLEFDLKKGRF